MLETLRDDNWGNHQDKKRKADQVILTLVMNTMGVNHSLVLDYVSYIGKIDDNHLMYVSDHHYEMNEERVNFFESYVYEHLISIEASVLSKLSFVSKRDSVSNLEFRREISDLKDKIERKDGEISDLQDKMQRKDREISALGERLDRLEDLVQNLLPDTHKERRCKDCGSSFTLENTPCRFHTVFF
eukprot:TRINITY_DN88_c0_g1_i4.p1 TRINITY_DN88_c0_g1~~TRINITY_DN88_c0_g1_i4.p1  ORF type:complete len:186 (+),score=39.58 TRINITY_DN88_c0_g1_i4:581-1138(+)